jgi:valyl-tRNA synthetase
VAIGRGYEAYIPADGLIDIGKERLRLSSEVGRITKIIKGLDAKLGSANFVDRAPPEVLAQTTLQRDNLNMQLLSLTANIEALA